MTSSRKDEQLVELPWHGTPTVDPCMLAHLQFPYRDGLQLHLQTLNLPDLRICLCHCSRASRVHGHTVVFVCAG